MRSIIDVCTRTVRFTALIFVILTFFGCATMANRPLTNVYTHPNIKTIKIHDIAVITFANASNTKKDISASVTKQFITEFNKRGWYVLHEIDKADLEVPEKIARIDAVLTGTILEYRDYEPLRFGVKLVLKDLTTGETIWSVQEVFDASRHSVIADVKSYYDTYVSQTNPVKELFEANIYMGYKLYLISMNKFTEFCFNKIVDTLR